MMPQLTKLDHLVLTTFNIDACISFYTIVLGMKARRFQITDGASRHALYFGVQKINIHLHGAEFSPHANTPLPGSADLCFLSETPLAGWMEHLKIHNVTLEDGPVQRSGATGPITSIYIRDPDGNLIEIANQN